MVDLKVCRICLVMDVKMFNIFIHPLKISYDLLMEKDVPMGDLPMVVCYECAAQLAKFHAFKEKCERGQTALLELFISSDKLTPTLIKTLDRKELKLLSNIEFSQVTFYNIDPDAESNDNEIKTEPEDLGDLNENEDELKFNINLDDDFKFNNEFSNDQTSLKYEDESDRAFSSDNEPLSLHKEKKKKQTKRGRKKKYVETDDVDDKSLIDLLNGDTVGEEVFIEVKPKRGRPRKNEVSQKKAEKIVKQRRTNNTGGVLIDDIDVEEYCTVVTLTEEEQKQEIEQRQQSSNYLNAVYQCNICYKGFIDTQAWNHHVGKHDPSAGDAECPICKFRFKTKRMLQKHITNHEKKYSCKSCSYVSKTPTQAKQHQKWHKGVTYKCQYCGEISTKWTSYLSHVRIKHPSDFICDVCGYSFVSKLGLTMHKTMMHKDIITNTSAGDDEKNKEKNVESNEESPYCTECDVKFVSLEAYKRHMVTSVKHTQSTAVNHGCRVCGEMFTDGESLRLHHRRDHAKKRPKNYGKRPTGNTWPAKCEHCAEEIPNAREYWNHFRRAHPDKSYPLTKNYICDICGKGFRGNAFLVYHKRTHFAERAYACTQCPKSFFNRINLQMHEKTHSEHRPYPCSMCAKAFKSKGALNRHFRSHTGVKPYVCEVCGKAFAQSNSRKLHVRTVHLKQSSPYISKSRLERRNKLIAHKEHNVPQFLY